MARGMEPIPYSSVLLSPNAPVVGAARFELAASSSQSWRSTRLSYAPKPWPKSPIRLARKAQGCRPSGRLHDRPHPGFNAQTLRLYPFGFLARDAADEAAQGGDRRPALGQHADSA